MGNIFDCLFHNHNHSHITGIPLLHHHHQPSYCTALHPVSLDGLTLHGLTDEHIQPKAGFQFLFFVLAILIH